jgi:hypothetical protein
LSAARDRDYVAAATVRASIFFRRQLGSSGKFRSKASREQSQSDRQTKTQVRQPNKQR